MLYAPEEKRKIILNNYTHPIKQVAFEELKKISDNWQTPLLTVRSLDEGCGDVLHLLIVRKDNYIEKFLFSGQQSCLITVAVANILCSCLEGKDLSFARELIINFQNMVAGKDYNLDNCPDLQVFNDISQFPHRVECIKLVIRGIITIKGIYPSKSEILRAGLWNLRNKNPEELEELVKDLFKVKQTRIL